MEMKKKESATEVERAAKEDDKKTTQIASTTTSGNPPENGSQENPKTSKVKFADAELFDPARLRLSQDFAKQIDVKKALLTVPVRRPDRQSFIRLHPDPAFRLEAAVLELKDDRETYLVDPGLLPALPGEIVPKILFTAITRQRVLFLWPVRLPNADGRHDEWNRSALEGADMARSRWIRIASNMSLGAYEVFVASADIPEPEWPDVPFQKILEIAFRDRFIRGLDHPAIKKLRGEL